MTMSPDERDPNVLARRMADLTDEFATFKEEMAEAQERWLLERARLELATGMSEDTIPEHLWWDGPRVVQVVLDRVWDGGYRDGLLAAEIAVHQLLKASKEDSSPPSAQDPK